MFFDRYKKPFFASVTLSFFYVASSAQASSSCPPVENSAIFSSLAKTDKLAKEDVTLNSRAVAEIVEDADLTSRVCKTNALIEIASNPKLMGKSGYIYDYNNTPAVQECVNGANVNTLTLALNALRRLELGWSVERPTARYPIPDDEATSAVQDKLVATLTCLDKYPAELIAHKDLRDLRYGVEKALENTIDGYRAYVRKEPTTCEEAREKLEHGEKLRTKYDAFELTMKTIFVDAGTRIRLARLYQEDGASSQCMTYETALKETVAAIDKTRRSGDLSKSLEGWRWANDLAATRASYLIVQGKFDEAGKEIELLERADLSPDNDLYKGTLNAVAVQVLEQLNAERKTENREAYQDQVFVSHSLTGYSSAEAGPRRYFSNSDVARGLRGTLETLQKLDSFEKCEGDCEEQMMRVSQELRKRAERTDVVVVTGSYQTLSRAKRGQTNACSLLDAVHADESIPGELPSAFVSDRGVQCPLRVKEVGDYHRLSTGELPEETAVKLRDIFKTRRRPVYLSRPRVIGSL